MSSIERKCGLEGSSKQTKQISVIGAMAKKGMSQQAMMRRALFIMLVVLEEGSMSWSVLLSEVMLGEFRRGSFANDLVFAVIAVIPASALDAAAMPKRGTEPVIAPSFAKRINATSMITKSAVHTVVETVRRIFLERPCDSLRHTTTRPSARSTTSETIPATGIQVRSVTGSVSFTASPSAVPKGREMNESNGQLLF